jgi:hypothetical protein
VWYLPLLETVHQTPVSAVLVMELCVNPQFVKPGSATPPLEPVLSPKPSRVAASIASSVQFPTLLAQAGSVTNSINAKKPSTVLFLRHTGVPTPTNAKCSV